MSGAESMAAALVIIAFLAGPIGRAIARRIAGQSAGPSGEVDSGRISELEQRMGELETAQARIAELEERLDFAERRLAQPQGDQEKSLPMRSVHG